MKTEIKMVIFDIDGVLTDGNVYVDETGKESKIYSLTEIDALNDIKRTGFLIGAITGEETAIVDVFEKRIGWDAFIRGCKNKKQAIEDICSIWGLESKQICYIGDGKYDVEAISYAGIGVCPQNAVNKAKEAADVVLSGRGGESCINELYELLTE